MKPLYILILAAAAFPIAGPLAAQPAGQAYDQAATVNLEGVVDTVSYSTTHGRLVLKPTSGAQMWDIELPDAKTLIDKGLSAEVLNRGAAVKVKAYKAKDAACNPDCKAEAVDLTIGKTGKSYALLGGGRAG